MENNDKEIIDMFLKNHAPEDWKSYFSKEKPFNYYLEANEPLKAIVMVADIRKSTILMKESTNFRKYAQGIGIMFTEIAKGIIDSGGWYDKFTGDGFIVYWLYRSENDWDLLIKKVIRTSKLIIDIFNKYTSDLLRKFTYNYPKDAGISIGVDAGYVYFAKILNDITIVGSSIVGAVRMVDAAINPNEIIFNNFPGYWMFDRWSSKNYLTDKINILKGYRITKEYGEQEVYLIEHLA